MLTRRFDARLHLAIAAVLLTATVAAAQGPAPTASPLAALMSGNGRYATNKVQAKDYGAERAKVAQGEHPYAIVVACADSRVAPEIVFDESLGRLFVVRTAGHVVDPVALGSIEYAVDRLHVSLLVVLGHENCGAVKATIGGGDASPNVRALTTRIRPAVEKVFARGLAEREVLPAAIRENVRYQMQKAVFDSDVLAEYIHHKKLEVVGGVYDMTSGKVEIISSGLAVDRPAARSRVEANATAASAPKTVSHHADVPTDFAVAIRNAYEKKLSVVVKRTMVMVNENDQCVTKDCDAIAPGETVTLSSPHILGVMGRPQIKVRYKNKQCFISADANAYEIVEN